VIIGFTAVYLPLALRFFTKLAKMEQAKQDSWYNLFGIVADCITNIFTIFSFAAKKRELNKVQDYNRNVHNPLTIKYYKYDLIISIILSLVYWVYVIGVLIYVIHLRNLGEISIGDIAFIMSLTFLFAENSWHATMAVKDFLEDVAAFRSSFTIMQIPQDNIDKENAAELKISKGEIIFKDISFAYKEGSSVFQSLNLHIKAGEKVGIVGHSGSGKSTLIALLLKNFKALSGDIIIDNQSIYDTSSDSLREQISLIPQDIMLFHRSVGENIGYAKENALSYEIENAARAANIHEFIEGLPEKYNTIVGERGIKLSGGQRQRIAIARAILKNAPILVLDEATSSLDSHTEQEVQKSINTMLDIDNVTIIAIAHRLSTIKHMDRIIVMDKGKIVEDGNFKELVCKEKGKFKELWEHQVNGFV
ncbi:MAG TPA: ABC transporter ATP-binding protein/permease, partial [Rickettsia endosymbiont of Omalisus fontisbellaquei]|nr:ABC transporter ATP-binding protein/permease [Rickettsia endosymbiont of Omalisus fontisbellaquei]